MQSDVLSSVCILTKLKQLTIQIFPVFPSFSTRPNSTDHPCCTNNYRYVLPTVDRITKEYRRNWMTTFKSKETNHKGYRIIPIIISIKSNSCKEIYSLKIYTNILLPTTSRHFQTQHSCYLLRFYCALATGTGHFNLQ